MKPSPPRGAGVPEGDSRQETAFTRLKARYAEARNLVFSAAPHSNLDWILGVHRNPEESSEDLNRKMIPLLALWLEDLAAELERRLAPGPTSEVDEPARTARACAVESLREAASGFMAAVRREA
ncbi:MAG: hypothetical protein ACM3SU_08790 [Acidobacteriota bacterium]